MTMRVLCSNRAMGWLLAMLLILLEVGVAFSIFGRAANIVGEHQQRKSCHRHQRGSFMSCDALTCKRIASLFNNANTQCYRPVPINFVRDSSERNGDDDSVLFGQVLVSNDDNETERTTRMMDSLRARQEALEQGIGKRFRVCTQRGFLNVHSCHEEGPYAVNNIVNQLPEGQIVTSTGPAVEDWIPHDYGGWSIAKFGGFVWLEPLED